MTDGADVTDAAWGTDAGEGPRRMELHVDRLTLRVPGLSRDEGRRLAELVGAGMSRTPAGAAGVHAARLTVGARGGEQLEELAERIAAQLTSALRRSP